MLQPSVFLTNQVDRAGLSSVRRWTICVKLELFPSPSPRSGMRRLQRKWVLDKIFLIVVLLIALSSSRADDMCLPESLVVV